MEPSTINYESPVQELQFAHRQDAVSPVIRRFACHSSRCLSF
ncbi:MAG TPA: hypothetical protein VFQ36_09235 [Ktedonobacteraceae bacterium]|nr:hypothetical protein [Ktedonobacteraceae bacterium]